MNYNQGTPNYLCIIQSQKKNNNNNTHHDKCTFKK